MICDNCKHFENYFEKTGTAFLKEVKKCNEVNMRDSTLFKVSLINNTMENCTYFSQVNTEYYLCGDAGLDCVWQNDICINPYHEGEFTK